MATNLNDSSHHLDHRPPQHGSDGFADWAEAAISAVCVGILAFTTLGGLFMALTGVGLFRMGTPELVIWSADSIIGAGALYLSVMLARHVWRFERDSARHGHHAP
jgi:hypothetical protein